MATASPLGPLARVAQLLEPHLDEVERRIAQQAAAFDPDIEGYVTYAVGGRGKRLRPLVALLAGGATGEINSGHIDLAIIVELIHLATLVHDDAVDHSVLRRGMPTLNSLFTHQISVIMGDFLYSIALTKLVTLADIDALRALTRASTEMTIGEMRQLAVNDSLSFSEDDYYALIRSKTASLMSAACGV